MNIFLQLDKAFPSDLGRTFFHLSEEHSLMPVESPNLLYLI